MGLQYITPIRGGYNPLNISGCVLWLDATDNSTITLSSGKASQWNDKSGSGNNVTQGTAADRPTPTASAINGLQAMQLDRGATNTTGGMKGTLTGGTLSAHSAFAVCVPTTLQSFSVPLATETNASDLTLEISGVSNTTVDIWINGVGHTTNGGTIAANGKYCMAMVYDATTLTNYLNNSSVSSGASASRHFNSAFGVMGNSSGGAGFYSWRGYVGEVVVYNKSLSTTERNNLYNNYLKPRWGLP